MQAPTVEAIATVVLAVITAAYAWLTKRMADETKRMADEMARQNRPYVFLKLEEEPERFEDLAVARKHLRFGRAECELAASG